MLETTKLETLPPTSLWHLPISADLLLAEYITYREAAGYVAEDPVRLWGARAFLQRYPNLESWRSAPLAEQLGPPRGFRAFLNFLFLKHYLRPPLSYLLAAQPQLAKLGQRYFYPDLSARFDALGHQLGYCDGVVRAALQFLFYVMVYAGKPADDLTAADLAMCEAELRTCQLPAPHSFSLRTYSQHLYQVRGLLFHAGILPEATSRHRPQPARARTELWAGISASLCQLVWRYLDQLRSVRAPETVTNLEGYLRRFFTWLAKAYPEVQELRALRRVHIEAFKLWLRETRCVTGKPYHVHTVGSTLSALRCFLQALEEWGWPEAPERRLMFASDLPLRDQPLPRFLDDPQAAALLHAAQASPDLFTRVCVETLLRTGLRKGEFVRLELDSVVQIGDSFWLRVPLGKLHNDRYVPLHPEVKRLLDEWLAQRGEQLRTNDLFVIHGRRVSVGRVDEAVHRAARAAGLPNNVSPHRLRHTLATQAINRGMSLEAIAALLGHRSLTMTLVYARIANRTVQAQYASVSDSLDALYAGAALGIPAPEPEAPTDPPAPPASPSSSLLEKIVVEKKAKKGARPPKLS